MPVYNPDQMYIKRLLILILPLLTIIFPIQIVNAATVASTFQITTDGSQQTSPFIDNNQAVYTSNSDIWGFDFDTATNFSVLEKDGQQFTTDLFNNLVVYEDTPTGETDSDVRLYNKKTGKDKLIAGGSGSEAGGVTNGKYVIYINNGACGEIHAYNINTQADLVISQIGCQPLRVDGNIVVWPNGAPDGTNIYGYDLKSNQSFDVVNQIGFQESPNIFENRVVYVEYGTGVENYNAIKMKNIKTGTTQTIYESTTSSVQWPSISNRYVVWSESTVQHVNGIQAADLKTGQVFEVQAQGPHQNSHTMPDIWRNIAVWMSFRTGNGDIYGSEFSKAP